MKKLHLCNWLLAGAMGAALFACQSKQSSTPSPRQAPLEDAAPCKGDDCPAPPESDSQDKVPCREDECDEQEAGEEAMIHVIEIDAPAEEKSAATVESPSALESAPAKEETVTLEPDPSNNVSVQSSEAKLESQESSESTEINLEGPSFTEEPTTNLFDDLPSNPISDSTMVLSLEK